MGATDKAAFQDLFPALESFQEVDELRDLARLRSQGHSQVVRSSTGSPSHRNCNKRPVPISKIWYGVEGRFPSIWKGNAARQLRERERASIAEAPTCGALYRHPTLSRSQVFAFSISGCFVTMSVFRSLVPNNTAVWCLYRGGRKPCSVGHAILGMRVEGILTERTQSSLINEVATPLYNATRRILRNGTCELNSRASEADEMADCVDQGVYDEACSDAFGVVTFWFLYEIMLASLMGHWSLYIFWGGFSWISPDLQNQSISYVGVGGITKGRNDFIQVIVRKVSSASTHASSWTSIWFRTVTCLLRP
ncbi:uncharacterized protein BT62DRAFT_1077521, partial [Guyanagaster necrorhizus]